jgi:hypothetical protein
VEDIMKLAEALIQRANLQERLKQLRGRLVANAKVQEGSKPAEDPNQLLTELERVHADLEDLIRGINYTNTQTQLEGVGTLTDALAKRDVLAMRQQAYRELADAATINLTRVTRTELRSVSTVDVQTIRKQADDCAKKFRELDTEIQSTNWLTELLK